MEKNQATPKKKNIYIKKFQMFRFFLIQKI